MRRRDVIAVLGGAAASMALASSIAWAAIPGPSGVIQGCYDSGGNVKVVEALPCPRNYVPFQWNQQGIQGIQGPQGERGLQGPMGEKGDKGDRGELGPAGPQGERGVQGETGLQGIQGIQGPPGSKGDKGDTGLQGLPGAQGPAGISGYEVVTGTAPVGGFGSTAADAFCPAGKKALGGGVWTNHSLISRSAPFGNGWTGAVRNPFVDGETITVYAICATTN